MIEIPYELLFLNMFNDLKKYGNKKYVKKEGVQKYISKYLELARLNALEEGRNNIEFNEYDVEDEMQDFLRSYGEYFYAKDNKYYYYDDADFDDVERSINIIEEDNELDFIFKNHTEEIELLKAIGATYMHDEYSKLLKLENDLEDAYYNYVSYPSEETFKKLKALVLIKNINMHNLKNISPYYLDGIFSTSIDFTSLSLIIYDEIPFDVVLWDAVPHVNELDSSDLLLELPQYAIFGNKRVSNKKLDEDIDAVFKSESIFPEGILDFLFGDTSLEKKINDTVYLKYLFNLDKYMKEHNDYDESLLRIKAKLMYLLDNPDLCLFMENNFKKANAIYDEARLNIISIYKIADEARFFIIEVFVNQNMSNVKPKLLLMKTYYDLTHDEDFKTLFETFEGQPNYDYYKEMIFGKNKTLKQNYNA